MQLYSEEAVLRTLQEIYCKAHHQKKELCGDCIELYNYAQNKIAKCTHLPNKPPCSKCTIHCFSPEKRSQILRVMRYAGPRLILVKPLWAIIYLTKKCSK